MGERYHDMSKAPRDRPIIIFNAMVGEYPSRYEDGQWPCRWWGYEGLWYSTPYGWRNGTYNERSEADYNAVRPAPPSPAFQTRLLAWTRRKVCQCFGHKQFVGAQQSSPNTVYTHFRKIHCERCGEYLGTETEYVDALKRCYQKPLDSQ